MELATHGIRVNSLTPTATDPSESVERAARWGARRQPVPTSQRRLRVVPPPHPDAEAPCPSDYGRAAAFLASHDAAMITGTDLRIDAGAIARYWAWDPSTNVA